MQNGERPLIIIKPDIYPTQSGVAWDSVSYTFDTPKGVVEGLDVPDADARLTSYEEKPKLDCSWLGAKASKHFRDVVKNHYDKG